MTELLNECEKKDMKLSIVDDRLGWNELASRGEQEYKRGVKACVERFAEHPACFIFMTGDESTGGNFRRQNARILHNSTYKGYPAYLKSRRNNFLDQKIIRNRDEDTYLYVKGDFEPIISDEQWDRCRQIREQRVRRNKILTENGEKSHLTGVHTSDDVWTKKLRCRCGYRMRRNKWRKNRNGELIC